MASELPRRTAVDRVVDLRVNNPAEDSRQVGLVFGLPTLPPPLNEVLLFPDGQVFADVLSLSIVSRLHMASVAQPDDDVPAFLRGDRLFVSITDLLRRDVFASREEHVVFEHVQGLVRRYARAHAMKDAAVRKVEMGKAIEELERYVNREGSEG